VTVRKAPTSHIRKDDKMTKQTEDTSTSLEARAEELEHLIRACLLYIKELSDYNWRSAPRTIALQDRAAALGIVVELKP